MKSLQADKNSSEKGRNGGFCARCGCWHELPFSAARLACRELMADLEAQGRIDFLNPLEAADPRLATAPLFAPGGGKMLGLLLGQDARGNKQRLLAFSGMFGGLWQVPGWAGPLFDETALHRLHDPAVAAIRELTRRMATLPVASAEYQSLRQERRQLSRDNMQTLFQLYQVGNFRGEQVPLPALFPANSGPPTGSGDCCAPKLLHAAQQLGLRPCSMAEFFWGTGTATRKREHGQFCLPCVEKCQPILGFMLCGLDAGQTESRA